MALVSYTYLWTSLHLFDALYSFQILTLVAIRVAPGANPLSPSVVPTSNSNPQFTANSSPALSQCHHKIPTFFSS
jgi:hypothetical protein